MKSNVEQGLKKKLHKTNLSEVAPKIYDPLQENDSI